jgi:hypothetical protein
MIQVLGVPGGDGELELSFRRPPLSERSAMPVMIGIGDPVAGPLVGLFYDAPSTPEQLAGPPDLAPAHSHPCDNFRVVMKGELIVGQERYHPGEFRLQQTGRPYGRDGDAPHAEGNWRVIFFADRRGHRVRPTNPGLRAQYASEEAIAQTKERFGDVLPVVLDDADDGVDGLVTTIDKPWSRLGHIDGSFEDADSWRPIGDGSRIAVSLMGVHDVGPVVIVQRTPPEHVAVPAVTFGADVFRCVVRGSYRRGPRTVETGDTLVRPAGASWEDTVAGAEGVDEVVIIGDRQGALPSDGGAWGDTLREIVLGLEAQLPTLASA